MSFMILIEYSSFVTLLHLYRVVNVCSFVAVMTWGRMGDALKDQFRNVSSEEELNSIVNRFIK